MEKAAGDHLSKFKNPIKQALIVFACVLFFDLGAFLLRSAGVEIESRFPWTITASFILFFAIFNSLFSLIAKDMENYWGLSVISYVALAVGSGLVAWLFSSLSINEAGPYRWLYIVLTFGYLIFLSIIRFMKNIVEFAQREEWSQPRARKGKK